MIRFSEAAWTAILAADTAAGRSQALATLNPTTIEFLDAADAVIRTVTTGAWTVSGANAVPGTYTDAGTGGGTPATAVFKAGATEIMRMTCGTLAGADYRLLANIVAGVPIRRGPFAVLFLPSPGAGQPAVITAPTITGTARVGETLYATPGTYSGTPTPTVVWSWTRDGVQISGATDTFYTQTTADLGALIRFQEVVGNALGSITVTSDPVGPVQNEALAASALPSPIQIYQGQTFDFEPYIAGGTPPYSVAVASGFSLPTGVSWADDTTLQAAGDAPATTTLDIDFEITDSDTGTGDWATRSTAAGVIWAHDFQSDDELYNFVRGSSTEAERVTNPNPAKQVNPLTLVPTPFGAARAIRSRAVGTAITQDVPQDLKGATRTIHVADASLFPEPGGTLGDYKVYIGCTGTDNTNPVVFEEVTVTARNTTENTLTVTRTSASSTIRVNGTDYPAASPYAPAIPASNGRYRIGYTNSGSWNRPMCAFPATQNGKASDDIGITNGSAAKARTWNATRNGTGHEYFREGYWGSKWYWDTATNPSAPYKDWTPIHTGDGQAFVRPDAFEGDEFYLQFRFKVSATRLQNVIAKLAYLQNAATSGAGQVFWTVGNQYASVTADPAERVSGSTIGCPVWTDVGGGDSRQPAGWTFASTVQTDSRDPPGSTPWHVDYPSGTYESRNGASCYAFVHQSDVWVTMLLHMKLGRDNAEAHHPSGVGAAGVSAPFPGASDASYRTILEVKVALPGWSDYKTLVSLSDALWFFGDSLGDVGNLIYNPPGLNTFWMTQEFNMYVGSGSACPPDGVASAEFTQAILSRNPIPVPTV